LVAHPSRRTSAVLLGVRLRRKVGRESAAGVGAPGRERPPEIVLGPIPAGIVLQ